MPSALRSSVPIFAVALLIIILVAPRFSRQDRLRRELTHRRRTEPLQWGVYQIFWGRDYGRRLREEIAPFASKPDYVMFYRDLDRPFPKLAVDDIYDVGATPMISLELWRWHEPKKPCLPAIVRGDYDNYLKNWARRARVDGRRILLRFGFEFNGEWFNWSLDPDGYVSAWRRARDIFRRERADNVEWVWSPNVVSCPDRPENNMHRYYPGDSYADWVSLDGYNFGEHHDKWHHWESFGEIFCEALESLQAHYPAKPVIISEFGCAPGKEEERVAWIRNAYDTLQHYPQIKAVIWFNYDKRRENEPNWRIDVTRGSLDAFNETFARRRSKESD